MLEELIHNSNKINNQLQFFIMNLSTSLSACWHNYFRMELDLYNHRYTISVVRYYKQVHGIGNCRMICYGILQHTRDKGHHLGKQLYKTLHHNRIWQIEHTQIGD